MAASNLTLSQLLRTHQGQVLSDWLSRQLQSLASRRDLLSERDLGAESQQFLETFTAALESNPDRQIGPAWDRLHDMLASLSVSRARLGFSPSETATFVFSLKEPV